MRKFILYLILGVALSIGMNAAPLLQADEPLVYAQIDVQDYQPQIDFDFGDSWTIVPTVPIVLTVPIETVETVEILRSLRSLRSLRTLKTVGYIDQFRLCGADDSDSRVYMYDAGFRNILKIPV